MIALLALLLYVKFVSSVTLPGMHAYSRCAQTCALPRFGSCCPLRQNLKSLYLFHVPKSSGSAFRDSIFHKLALNLGIRICQDLSSPVYNCEHFDAVNGWFDLEKREGIRYYVTNYGQTCRTLSTHQDVTIFEYLDRCSELSKSLLDFVVLREPVGRVISEWIHLRHARGIFDENDKPSSLPLHLQTLEALEKEE